jgi:putative oxidoreductase
MKLVLTKMSQTIVPKRETHTSMNKTIVALGRIFFSLIFIAAGLNHFTSSSVALAESHGLPLASIAVPLSGMVALAGGLSVLLGYRAKLGAWLLVLFLVPVTLAAHRFWGIPDPREAELQLIMFMKNVSMIGGALLISQFGAGPLSLDARRRGSRTQSKSYAMSDASLSSVTRLGKLAGPSQVNEMLDEVLSTRSDLARPDLLVELGKVQDQVGSIPLDDNYVAMNSSTHNQEEKLS